MLPRLPPIHDKMQAGRARPRRVARILEAKTNRERNLLSRAVALAADFCRARENAGYEGTLQASAFLADSPRPQRGRRSHGRSRDKRILQGKMKIN